MKQQLTIFYTPHYNGTGTTPDRYVFMGVCEWLDEPFTRRTDCIALISPDFRWGSEDENYTLYASCHLLLMQDGECVMDEDIMETFDGNDAEVSSFAGVFFEYNLYDDILTNNTYRDCTNFSFLMLAVGKVSMDVSSVNNIGIDFVYTHSRTSLAPTINFSWDGTGLSASISVSVTTTTKKYILNDAWRYKRHYDEFFA